MASLVSTTNNPTENPEDIPSRKEFFRTTFCKMIWSIIGRIHTKLMKETPTPVWTERGTRESSPQAPTRPTTRQSSPNHAQNTPQPR